MNFKLFSHLIIAQLSLGWWSVVSEEIKDETLESDEEKILKLVTNYPNVYQDVRAVVRKLVKKYDQAIGKCAGIKLCYDEEKIENRALSETANKNKGVVRKLKLRDWIVDLEEKFPLWLSYLQINRYHKWILALKFVQGPFFDFIRNNIEKNNINDNDFAAEIYSIYEETSSFVAHNSPEVQRPKLTEIEEFCKSVTYDYEERNLAACQVLLTCICVGRTEVPTTTVPTPADSYPTNFFVIITNYKKTLMDCQICFSDVLKKIESNTEFITQKCAIVTSFVVGHSETDNTEHARRQKIALPAMVFRICLPLQLRGVEHDDLKSNKVILDNLQDAIKADLLTVVPNTQGTIHIMTEYISHEWFMASDANPSSKGETTKQSDPAINQPPGAALP